MAIKEMRLWSSLTANLGSRLVARRVVVRVPMQTDTVSRTRATTPEARVVYQIKGLVDAINCGHHQS
jgi:hypothetical protein